MSRSLPPPPPRCESRPCATALEADRFRELLQRRPLRLRVIPAGEVASAVPTPKTLLRELAADQNFEDAWRTDEERRLARRGDVDAEDLEDHIVCVCARTRVCVSGGRA